MWACGGFGASALGRSQNQKVFPEMENATRFIQQYPIANNTPVWLAANLLPCLDYGVEKLLRVFRTYGDRHLPFVVM
ncbi:hypothetical protein DF3PB_600021 [uncultured Defluviicoccus sp.]|uniref:Uncharacterized protein n=1 Tax=metagenome TaxID=256318 RepID=A0A380TJQ0_9ZZZZ|nr:hypothetical protein DF3PB_600021 [uncultured Defluviicoccus sp.]